MNIQSISDFQGVMEFTNFAMGWHKPASKPHLFPKSLYPFIYICYSGQVPKGCIVSTERTPKKKKVLNIYCSK